MSRNNPKWFSLIDSNLSIKKKRIDKSVSNDWSTATVLTEAKQQTTTNASCSFFTNQKPPASRRIQSSRSAQEYHLFVSDVQPSQDDLISSDSNSDIEGEQDKTEIFRKSMEDDWVLMEEEEEVDETEEVEAMSMPAGDQLSFLVNSGSENDDDDYETTAPTVNKRPVAMTAFDSALKQVANKPPAATTNFNRPYSRSKHFRGALSTRLETILRRKQSDRVVWLHTHADSNQMVLRESASQMEHDIQIKTFRIKAKLYCSTSGNNVGGCCSRLYLLVNPCAVDDTDGDDADDADVILLLSRSSLSDHQWSLLDRSLSLNITLKRPWSELMSPEGHSILFEPHYVGISENLVPASKPLLLKSSVACGCINSGPDAWESCKYRYCRSKKMNLETSLVINSLPFSSPTSTFLVIYKSLFWFHAKLRYAYVVKFLNGFLAVWFLPTSLFMRRSEACEGLIHRPTSQLASLNPGCVYHVKSLAIVSNGTDNELSEKTNFLFAAFRNLIGISFEKLQAFTRRSSLDCALPVCLQRAVNAIPVSKRDETHQNNGVPFYFLNTTTKQQLNLSYSLFMEGMLTSPHFSTDIRVGCRCELDGILLHEFPSGSTISERIIASIGHAAARLLSSSSLSSLFVLHAVVTESGSSSICLIACTGDAATPLQLLSSPLSPLNISIDLMHTPCRASIAIFGLVYICEGLFLLDAFSRVEIMEINQLPPRNFPFPYSTSRRMSPLPPPPISSGAGRCKIQTRFITSSGRVKMVDGDASQVWPLCAACLSDDLKLPESSPKSASSSSSASQLECQRCLAKIDRPCHACEIIFELEMVRSFNFITASRSGPSCIKVCMLPSRVSHMLGIAEAQLHKSSLLDPSRLIGQMVNGLTGLVICIPSRITVARNAAVNLNEYDAVIIELEPGLLE